MDAISSTATLTIREIRNVNLSWVRDNLGDLTSLRRSIKKDGLKLPILMTTSLLVADGARRLVACEELGWDRVPVFITSDWDQVRKYYAAARELTSDGWPSVPMPWADLPELLGGPLKELYSERYRELRNETTKRNNQLRQRGVSTKRNNKTLYSTECAEVLGFRSHLDVETIRECYNNLALLAAKAAPGEDPRAVTQRQEWGKMLADQMLVCEDEAGERLYALRARIRMACRGKDPTAVGHARGRRTVIGAGSVIGPSTAPTGREMDGAMLTSITALVQQLGDMAQPYTHVRPNVPTDIATQRVEEMKASVRRLNVLIKVIRDYANSNPNLEESTE